MSVFWKCSRGRPASTSCTSADMETEDVRSTGPGACPALWPELRRWHAGGLQSHTPIAIGTHPHEQQGRCSLAVRQAEVCEPVMTRVSRIVWIVASIATTLCHDVRVRPLTGYRYCDSAMRPTPSMLSSTSCFERTFWLWAEHHRRTHFDLDTIAPEHRFMVWVCLRPVDWKATVEGSSICRCLRRC